MSSLSSNNKKILRHQLKKIRLSASKKNTLQTSKSILQQLKKLFAYRTAKNIGLYISFSSELPTKAIFKDSARKSGSLKKRTLAVPVITSFRKKAMQFMLHEKQVRKNRLNIWEPKNKVQIKTESLDIIFIPLLGFDIKGNRIGMGGGYYDRELGFKNKNIHMKKPYLIGLAYEAQKVDFIKSESWDVKLDAIITEQNTYLVNSALR